MKIPQYARELSSDSMFSLLISNSIVRYRCAIGLMAEGH